MKIILSQQKSHFDQGTHQFDPDSIMSPTLAQNLEIEHVQNKILKNKPKKILDYGCGTGRMTIPLLEKGIDVYAVDVSTISLKILKNIYSKLKKKNWGKLYTYTKLPRNIRVDGIVGSDILHHVQIESILPSLFPLLNKSGIAVFSEPNAFHVPWYLFIAFNNSWDIEKGLLQCTYLSFQKYFREAGFRKVSLEGHGLLPTRIFNFSPVLCRINTFILPSLQPFKFFSFRFIIVAKK